MADIDNEERQGDLEDLRIAERRMADIKSGASVAVPLEEVAMRLDVKTERFRDVWEAIEADPVIADDWRARSQLVIAIVESVRANGDSLVASAKRLGISPETLAELLHGDISLLPRDELERIALASNETGS